MNSALSKLLVAFVAVSSLYSSALAQSEWEPFESSVWGRQYLKKDFEQMEVGSTVTLLVNIDNPSKFPLLKEQKLNPKSVQFLYTINCKMKRRISWGSFTLFSKEWATGHVLAEGRFKEPDYQYSEQEWTQSGYEEKFCKKTKPFWRR